MLIWGKKVLFLFLFIVFKLFYLLDYRADKTVFLFGAAVHGNGAHLAFTIVVCLLAILLASSYVGREAAARA